MADHARNFDGNGVKSSPEKSLRDKENLAKQVVERQLKKNGIKKDDDVTELYLSHQNLECLCSYGRFRKLQYLWLNNNKLRSIGGALFTNYSIAELYLHSNFLTCIDGALRHLTNLRVLMLHNNQISNVERVVAELDKMQGLKILSLFDNPVCQEPDYRSYVIHYIPSVELLDRREVLRLERECARRQYRQEEAALRDTIAFGRRSAGPPILHYRRDTNQTPTVPDDFEFGNSFYRSHPCYATLEEALSDRLAKKSTMQFSHFDWASMPGSAIRRTSQKPEIDPQIVTVKFR